MQATPAALKACLIGGNIATNVGSNEQCCVHGVTRDQVYAVEVVTPTGEMRRAGSTFKEKIDRVLPGTADHGQ